ncbi:phiSA1p31-related protein [Streptomyces sp. NPDC050538]|uniref:phiSA1p31-related protein n=1 Tax=Streptomyces sp. NPDC050538 TaxID=3365627 RepID=UPI003792AAE1
MTTHNYRFVDMDEQKLLILVDGDGRLEMHTGKVCSARAADLLEKLAARLRASHPPFPCFPSAAATPTADRPDEPLLAEGGRLDRSASVWTDGRGHTWDLSLTWVDTMGAAWRWYGSLDTNGAPLLRANNGDTVQALDVVRALYGPLAPVSGGVE